MDRRTLTGCPISCQAPFYQGFSQNFVKFQIAVKPAIFAATRLKIYDTQQKSLSLRSLIF